MQTPFQQPTTLLINQFILLQVKKGKGENVKDHLHNVNMKKKALIALLRCRSRL